MHRSTDIYTSHAESKSTHGLHVVTPERKLSPDAAGGEFTGERVIPGLVDPNLWGEHFARYAFAARLSRNKTVLDVGCGTGYGAAEVADQAQYVTGIDIAKDALEYARTTYPSVRNARWIQASCTSLPVCESSFDVVLAFEVIEHLADWAKLIEEAARVLVPGGQFIVSTPNRSYYAETRRLAGPNPFHVHEFDFDEFRQALGAVFPYVSIFVEDHNEGIVLRSLGANSGAEVRLDGDQPDPLQSNFFLAVCAKLPQSSPPSFVYMPKAANLLKERESHIQALEEEIKLKDAWLEEQQAEHIKLLEAHRLVVKEIEERTNWAKQLDLKVKTGGERIIALQEELKREQAGAFEVAQAYETKVRELERVSEEKTNWALETERRLGGELDARGKELVRCVELLHEAERLTDERTAWAQRLDKERGELEAALHMAQASRWVQLGRKLNVGPKL